MHTLALHYHLPQALKAALSVSHINLNDEWQCKAVYMHHPHMHGSQV